MSEPSIDAAIAAAEREGWGFFDHAADPKKVDMEAKAKSERGERVALTFARLSTQGDFAEALEFLADHTIRRATFTAQLGLDPMQAYSFGVFREGQNALMASILKLIAIGRKLPPPTGRDP